MQHRLAFFLVCLGLHQAFSAEVSPAGQEPRIVVIGDSLSAGYGLHASEAYPALLQEKITSKRLPWKVINAGVSGDTTAGGLRRLDWSLSGGAQILIIALGGNDGLRGLSPEQTRSNLNAMIQRAREWMPNIQIILAGMQMPDSMGKNYTAEFAAIFPSIAAEKHVLLLPFLLESVAMDPALNLPDLIHPNAAGQKVIANHFWEILEPLLTPPPSEQSTFKP